MSNYNSLKATINANIKTNGNQEITGAVLNSVLTAIVNAVGTGYLYSGIATPSTNPGTTDARVFFLAATPGTYVNFGNLVVNDGEVCVLKYDSSWHKEVTGIGSSSQIASVIKEVSLRLSDPVPYTWKFGAINASGSEVSAADYLRSDLIDVSNYLGVYVTGQPSFVSDSKIYICKYLNGVFVARVNTTGMIKDSSFNGVRILVGKGTGNMSEADRSTVTASVLNHVPSDIASVKEYVDDSIGDLTAKLYVPNSLNWEYGGISSTGSSASSTQYVRNPEVVDVSSLQKMKLLGLPDFITRVYVCKYLNGVFVERLEQNEIAVDSSFNGVRYVIGISSGSISDSQFAQIQQSVYYEAFISILNQKINATNKWKSKKMVALGDSIVYGYAPRNTPEYPGKIKSFVEIAAETLEMSIVNCGITGSFMQCKEEWGDKMFASYAAFQAADKDTTKIYGVQNSPDNYTSFTYYAYNGSSWVTTAEINNPMCLRASLLPGDADIVTIMGGTNDISQGGILGTPEDTDVYSFYGALDVAYKALYKKYFIDSDGRNRKVIVIIPPKKLLTAPTTQGGTGTLVDMESYSQAVYVVAKRYGFPVLDFQHDVPLNPHLFCNVAGYSTGYEGKYYNVDVPDGIHPSKAGQQILANAFLYAIG